MVIIETNLKFNSLEKRKTTKRIIYHHSAGNNGDAITIHKYHKEHNGWSGIAYHFVILRDGTIQRGRPVEMIGGHACNNNYDSIGICLIGDFERGYLPSEEQYTACIELSKQLLKMYGLTSRDMYRHSDVNATACPCDFDLERVKNAVDDIKPISKPIEISSILKYNSSGAEVKELQKLLNKRFNIGLEEDGKFGRITEIAVKLFQAVNGLTADGVVGVMTREKLKGV